MLINVANWKSASAGHPPVELLSLVLLAEFCVFCEEPVVALIGWDTVVGMNPACIAVSITIDISEGHGARE
jgi:hypothetical protein